MRKGVKHSFLKQRLLYKLEAILMLKVKAVGIKMIKTRQLILTK